MLETLITDLQRQGFSPIPFPLNRKELEQAADSFLDFLEVQEKDQFKALAFPGDRGSTVGYAKKQRTESAQNDNKEYCHYNAYFELYFGHLINSNERITRFAEQARKVYDASTKTILEILKQLEQARPGIQQEFISQNKPPKFYLRFIKYDTVGKDGTIAKGHYDRGAFTLALAESSPGLRIGTQENLAEIAHQDRQAVLFPGKDITGFFESIKPAWHDAVQKQEAQVRPGVARWAIVFFANQINQPEYTWEDAHTIIQY